MVQRLNITEFESYLDSADIIDVRSPAEFDRGHIPGARNIPIFNDEERSVVGTVYKKQGPEKAVVEGLRIVGPKMVEFVDAALRENQGRAVALYCWRGGQRSESMAWLFDKTSISSIVVLEGGYKSFRRHILASFSNPLSIEVLGGYTGTGKTELLRTLDSRNEQVVDLEGIANHKGSAFGGLGQPDQPSTEHFENLLWNAIRKMDPNRPIWMEDESRHIGSCRLPDDIYDQIREAPVCFIDLELEERVKRLTNEYGRFTLEELRSPLTRIEKRLGGQHLKAAMVALEEGNMEEVARITLRYYDKAYRYGLENRQVSKIRRITADKFDMDVLASKCVEHATRVNPNKINTVQ